MEKEDGDLNWIIATAAENGGHKFYQTVFYTLGRQLCDRNLLRSKRSLVEEAQKQEKIDYEQYNQANCKRSWFWSLKVLPSPQFTQLIDSFNKATAWKRKDH